MLNIPWYAWLNVLGLMLIWLLHLIGYHSNKSPTTLSWLNHFKMLSLILFIFLNWSQILLFELSYYLIGITLIVSVLVVRDIFWSVSELFQSISNQISNQKNKFFSQILSDTEILNSINVADIIAIEKENQHRVLMLNLMFTCALAAAFIPPVYMALKLSLTTIG